MDGMTKLAQPAIEILMPMHIWLDVHGRIRSVGPTLQKLRPSLCFEGLKLLEVFELRHPHAGAREGQFSWANGDRLRLRFKQEPRTAFKAQIVSAGDGEGAFVNLSFGIAAGDAVADYRLTMSDFAFTDQTVELLYLLEAKKAVMEETRRLTQRLQASRSAAEAQALTDTLTGLNNRRALDHVLKRLIGAGRPFAVMHLDLDLFKSVNDTHGHAAGDEVLKKVSRILVEETRAEDTVVRLGGDEFALILEGLIDGAQLNRIAHRIIERIEEPISFNGHHCKVSASVGGATSEDYRNPDVARILHDADMALYASKRSGRGRVSWSTAGCRPRTGAA